MPDGKIVMTGIFIFPVKRNLLTGTEPGMEPVGYQSETTAVYRPSVTLTLEGPFTALSRSCHHDSPQTCLDTHSFPGTTQPIHSLQEVASLQVEFQGQGAHHLVGHLSPNVLRH